MCVCLSPSLTQNATDELSTAFIADNASATHECVASVAKQGEQVTQKMRSHSFTLFLTLFFLTLLFPSIALLAVITFVFHEAPLATDLECHKGASLLRCSRDCSSVCNFFCRVPVSSCDSVENDASAGTGMCNANRTVGCKGAMPPKRANSREVVCSCVKAHST